MDFPNSYKLKRPVASAEDSLSSRTANLVSELMNAAVSVHKLHLKVSGTGSYASHKALNELYDALPGLADTIAEGFQGASETILDCCVEKTPKILYSVEECLNYLRELYKMTSDLQAVMPYSEIVNDLDNVKSQLNSSKYKLLFLK